MLMHLIHLEGTIKTADTVDTNIYCHFRGLFLANVLNYGSLERDSISPSYKGVI